MGLHRATLLVVAPGSLGFLFGCGSDERAPVLGASTCSTPGCGNVGGGTTGDASTEDGSTGDAGGEEDAGYQGERAQVTGTMFAMEPPLYWPLKASEPELAAPAQVVIWAYGEEHVGDYTPGVGFTMSDVPVGDLYVLARDVGDGNGILPTTVSAPVVAPSVSWAVPAVLRAHVEATYASVSPPLTIDPDRAQILFSISDCTGSYMLPGVTFNTMSDIDGVLVEDGLGGWQLDSPSGTGPNGVAFVVNVPAQPPPGTQVSLEYSYAGETTTGLTYRVMKGVVTRVHVLHGCTQP